MSYFYILQNTLQMVGIHSVTRLTLFTELHGVGVKQTVYGSRKPDIKVHIFYLLAIKSNCLISFLYALICIMGS